MNRQEFLTAYDAGLAALIRISREPGQRADYVQGGGGNTSAKLDGSVMAVKASGFRLGQITVDDAYAVLDYGALRTFFRSRENAASEDVESGGKQAVQAAAVAVAGLDPRRPSVEAGFHALLDTCVLHTHSVYANIACCSDRPLETIAEAMAPLGLVWGFVPYIDPGTRLTFAIAAETERVRRENGAEPSVLFLQNHGIVVSTPDAETCLEIHDRVNDRLAGMFGVRPGEWPSPAVTPAPDGTGYRSATPWLQAWLSGTADPVAFFTADPLYPDQMVYLTGKIEKAGAGTTGDAVCRIDTATGTAAYACGENEAKTIEETLCAVAFIKEIQQRAGLVSQPMDASARSFIAGWESEAYRRTITSGEAPKGAER